MTRRALLAAGAAVLAGCGRDERPPQPPPAAAALRRQLAAERATLDAYRRWRGPGGRAKEVRRMAARVRGHVTQLEAALRATGAASAAAGAPARGAPTPPPAPAGRGAELALARERAALGVHVRALPSLRAQPLRRLGADLVASAAQHEALLSLMLGRDPTPTAFPGQDAG